MTGADIMVRCLEAEGVDTIFGYPGVAICPFFNSILKSDIRSVLVRTEQNAAHAANGAARTTGKVGVCVATSGPGATNLLTGIATANADSIPLVCITGQVKTELIGRDVFQEADVTGAAESFVKYSYLVKDIEDLPRVFKEAFHIASTGRRGPVLIDVPIDVQLKEAAGFTYPESVNLRTYKPTVKGHAIQIKKVMQEIEKAQRPVIMAGGGVLLSDARDELLEFAEKFDIPVASTMMAIDAVPSSHRLNLGMVGNNGRRYANRAINEADLLIVIGCRFADRAVQQPSLIVKDKIVVHIDVDPAEIGKNASASIPLVGDAKHILQDFLKADYKPMRRDAWIAVMDEYREKLNYHRNPNPEFVDPENFIQTLCNKMDDDGVYVADVGQNQIWSCRYSIIKKGRFLTSGGMGTMGYSIPAAMGVRAANPEKQVVAVCGDGSFQMSMMELATIKQHNIPVKIVVLKNNVLGMVREYQHYTYNDHYSMIDLSGSPDLEKIAAAYDIPFIRMYNMEQKDAQIEAFLNAEGPVLMECILDPMDLVN
ncbi:MAG: biosynthetic-type acetolactate synthase large subunit [Lachnospiraceae bacterium]|nr:biosynthetic-type acetolactate synthase large subunit [Lachnospiraceae bacterium]